MATDTYPEEELFTLVGALSKATEVPVEDLVRAFGEYAFEPLTGIYPDSVKPGMTVKDFLKSVHGVIHVEVKKLYPDAALPSFDYEDPGPNELVMIYRSPRMLAALAEGLITGAAKHFNTQIDRKTVHVEGDDEHWRFELTFS